MLTIAFGVKRAQNIIEHNFVTQGFEATKTIMN